MNADRIRVVVDQSPTLWDIVSAICSALGVLGAAVAIVIAIRANTAARKMVAKERRIDFQLDRLAEITVTLPTLPTSGAGSLRARLLMLPDSKLPLTNALVFQGPGSDETLADFQPQPSHRMYGLHEDGRQLLEHAQAEVTAEIIRLRDLRD